MGKSKAHQAGITETAYGDHLGMCAMNGRGRR